ncbi:MAG: HNH endonuclease [Candidatus Brocadiales bacterium]|nr:HNH endonuclease [Candidatus Brocadiales bacterium]
MKVCNKCGVNKENTAFCKNKAKKDNINTICRDCIKAYHENNKEQLSIASKLWRLNNKDKLKVTSDSWYVNNTKVRLEKAKMWKMDNPDKVALYDIRRRRSKLEQLPEDANLEKIASIYKEARRLTKETGIQRHVDHIVPLSKGGLHHEDNLQILTAEENLRKGAKYEETI